MRELQTPDTGTGLSDLFTSPFSLTAQLATVTMLIQDGYNRWTVLQLAALATNCARVGCGPDLQSDDFGRWGTELGEAALQEPILRQGLYPIPFALALGRLSCVPYEVPSRFADDYPTRLLLPGFEGNMNVK